MEITSQEKKSRGFTDGFHEEAENKRKVGRRKEDGLLAEPVIKRVALNHVVGLLVLREESEDVALLAPPVKLTKGGRENDARLDDYTQGIDLS